MSINLKITGSGIVSFHKTILMISVLLPFLNSQLSAQDLSSLYEKVDPAVVVIFTEEKTLINNGRTTQTVASGGLGSGFLISDRQVISAAHVVQVAENVKVQFLDGEIIPAKVVSAYKKADLALLELVWPRKDAVTVALGDSDKVKVGNRVFVVGAPYGLSHSLSSGHVSGILKDDRYQNPFAKSEFIQTDAAINHGNSGGPMFNMKGEVVGIVSQILSESGGFDGIGFAATSNLAKNLLLDRNILWTGMDAVPLTGDLAKLFNLPQPAGLLVQKVVFLSSFGTLGLQGGNLEAIIGEEKFIVGGDIILSINGIRFDTSDETLIKIARNAENLKPADPFEIEVLRAGKVIVLKR
ncbi:MAG: trypsin-like peptidase domain-containing protein [Bacteroidota bacterium]